MEPTELSFRVFLAYLWERAANWQGFIQVLWLLHVLNAAALRFGGALLHALFYYVQAVLWFACQHHLGLNITNATTAFT